MFRVRRIKDQRKKERKQEREAHEESRNNATLFPGVETMKLECPECKDVTSLRHTQNAMSFVLPMEELGK